jgi:hypothetical protein
MDALMICEVELAAGGRLLSAHARRSYERHRFSEAVVHGRGGEWPGWVGFFGPLPDARVPLWTIGTSLHGEDQFSAPIDSKRSASANDARISADGSPVRRARAC